MSRQNNENSKRGQVAKLGLHVVGAHKRRRKVKIERPAPGTRGCVRSRFFDLSFKAS
jgi:hypothetical protein